MHLTGAMHLKGHLECYLFIIIIYLYLLIYKIYTPFIQASQDYLYIQQSSKLFQTSKAQYVKNELKPVGKVPGWKGYSSAHASGGLIPFSSSSFPHICMKTDGRPKLITLSRSCWKLEVELLHTTKQFKYALNVTSWFKTHSRLYSP